MRLSSIAVASCLSTLASSTVLPRAAGPLVSTPGQVAAIPSWDIQSSSSAPTDLTALSRTGADTSKWHHIPLSKCTLMGCLLADGTFKESDIFFSEKLKTVDSRQFTVPWLYRSEFGLESPKTAAKHYFLKTGGHYFPGGYLSQWGEGGG